MLGDGCRRDVALLSPRERQVMALLAERAQGPAGGRAAAISPDTVRTHVENAMNKLDARTRVHAIAIALRHRLIEIPDSTY